ncbi:MAG: hypothetical protein ACRD1X_12090 [Vicinamibacteria bacterium]
MLDFIAEHGTLLLAIYGVLQVWMIAAWKQFVSAARLSVHESARIEVGYSAYGPTVGLHGVLRTSNKNAFVESVRLVVIKLRDFSQHEFEWEMFRASQIRSDGGYTEIPAGFLVRLDQPYRYNIVFSDKRTQEEVLPSLLKVTREWGSYTLSKQPDIYKLMGEQNLSYEVATELLYTQEFIKTNGAWQQAWELLTRRNYWEAGEYDLSVTVKAAPPTKTISRQWRFTLDSNDADGFNLNAIVTLQQMCLGKGTYYFAYSDYDPTSVQS